MNLVWTGYRPSPGNKGRNGKSQGPQDPHRLGQVDAEDHQGAEHGRGVEASPCPAERGRGAALFGAHDAKSWRRSRRRSRPDPQSPKLLSGTGKDDTHLIIVATSDRGLAGAFNSNIVRAARRKAEELEGQGKTVLFYIVGRKGRPVLQRFYPKSIIAQYDTSEIEEPELCRRPGDREGHRRPLHDRRHRRRPPRLRQLPLDAGAGADGRPDHPGRAASCGRRRATSPASLAAVEYEPDEEEILADLLPRNIAVQLYRALLENQAGFYGSQMTAMDNATRNAGDMINKLSIQSTIASARR